jgi:hypothetical protein
MNSPRLVLIGVAALAVSISVAWYVSQDVKPEPGAFSATGAAHPGLLDSAKPSILIPTNADSGAREETANSSLSLSASSLGTLLKIQNSFERRHALEQFGYDSAKRGVQVAFAELTKIESQPEREAFVRGMFSQLAEGSSTDALRAIKAITQGPDRIAGLAALVETWQPELAPESKRSVAELRLGASEGMIIARLLGDPSLAVKYARELLSGSERLQILRSAAFLEASRDPQRALSFGQDLQGTDRTQFLEYVARGWARERGGEALAWASGEPDPAVREMLHREVLLGWGTREPAAALQQLAVLSDPGLRDEMFSIIVSEWAGTDTRAAMAWANGLPDAQQRERAEASIQVGAPVGIGVVLNMSEGLPNIADVVPGSSASAGGVLKAGYRIAAIGDGRGGYMDLQGVKLEDVTKMIRGKSGTSVALQVIPPGGSMANRVTVMVPRQQLLFKNPPPISKP